MTRVHQRWMIRRDFPSVLAIESASFGDPWDEDDFLEVLGKRNCIGMVAEAGEQVVGFMIYELHPGHIELGNFAVDPSHQREGIGSQMMAKLLGKLSPGRRTAIELHVRESNLSAQLFYRSHGFKATGVDRGYYEDPDEGAYVMRATIADDTGVLAAAVTSTADSN